MQTILVNLISPYKVDNIYIADNTTFNFAVVITKQLGRVIYTIYYPIIGFCYDITIFVSKSYMKIYLEIKYISL